MGYGYGLWAIGYGLWARGNRQGEVKDGTNFKRGVSCE